MSRDTEFSKYYKIALELAEANPKGYWAKSTESYAKTVASISMDLVNESFKTRRIAVMEERLVEIWKKKRIYVFVTLNYDYEQRHNKD